MHACRSTLRQFSLQKPAGRAEERAIESVAARRGSRGESESRINNQSSTCSSSVDMEMKMSSASGSGCKKRPPSRLQKHAPASLQLEQAAAGAGTGTGTGAAPAVWGDGGAPIPLLSPLLVSPTLPVWEADQAGAAARKEGGGDQLAEGRSGAEQQRGAGRHGGSGERQAHDVSPRPSPPAVGAGWLHPALSAPVGEPASLLPLFQSQCALEVRNAQQ